METVQMGDCRVSRFILDSNPFSGFSHQGHEMDDQMVHYYTCARIKEVLAQAEGLGINTIIARADHHMLRVLMEYWDEGGTLQLLGQTCPELGSPEGSIRKLAKSGAAGCHVHGGYADHLLANGRIEEIMPPIELARELDLTVGVAGHNPDLHRWVSERLDVDFHMCSYYNPIPRHRRAEHRAGTREKYRQEDRRAMTELIQELPKPAIHYKVMAAGRNDPREAFDHVARAMRPGDAVCVGVFTRDQPDMLAEDVRLLNEALKAHAAASG
jgi:hypothetical protein